MKNYYRKKIKKEREKIITINISKTERIIVCNLIKKSKEKLFIDFGNFL